MNREQSRKQPLAIGTYAYHGYTDNQTFSPLGKHYDAKGREIRTESTQTANSKAGRLRRALKNQGITTAVFCAQHAGLGGVAYQRAVEFIELGQRFDFISERGRIRLMEAAAKIGVTL